MPKIEGLLPEPPTDWPWALPHLYCVETVSEPGEDVVGYSAHKDGTGEARVEPVKERTRVNVVGYWKGAYAVVWSKVFLKRADAEREADGHFKIKPMRYRVNNGETIRLNEAIQITGDWPESWEFTHFWNLGSFCAFLYREALAAGRAQEADAFKASLHQVMPGSEAMAMFHGSLSKAKKLFGEHLKPKVQATLDTVLAKMETRIGTSADPES
jgi:hypothetical protein